MPTENHGGQTVAPLGSVRNSSCVASAYASHGCHPQTCFEGAVHGRKTRAKRVCPWHPRDPVEGTGLRAVALRLTPALQSVRIELSAFESACLGHVAFCSWRRQ